MYQDPQNRTNVVLVRPEKELLEESAMFNFKSFKIFHANLFHQLSAHLVEAVGHH